MDAPLLVTLASAAVASSLPLLVWGLAGVGRQRGRARAGPFDTDERQVMDEHELRLEQPIGQRIFGPVVRGMGRLVRKFTPAGWVNSLDKRIKLAGSPKAWPLERALAAKLMLGIGTLLVGALAVLNFPAPEGSPLMSTARIALVPMLAIFAYRFPDLALQLRGKERQQTIQITLPDALDQMSISVEAGLGFDAALGRVVETGKGPLVEEMHRTLQDIAIGVPRKQAFRNLVERTDVPELRHFVFAVNQAEEYGLPIAQVLRVQSKELRVIRRQRAEEKAMKIPVKIVFPLIMCIFPALFVVLLVPAAIRIIETLSG